MIAIYDQKAKCVRIDLVGTPVSGNNPKAGDGRIDLTSYGAKKIAYQLLAAATDIDHYEK